MQLYSLCPVKRIASSGKGLRLNCRLVARYTTNAENATIKSPIMLMITASFGKLEYSPPL